MAEPHLRHTKLAKPETASRPTTRKRTAKPPEQRTHAITGHSGKPFKGERAQCACGCGEWFLRDKATQRFVRDHRFTAYQWHECKECGAVHRIKVRKSHGA